jgi:hypothetical protein
MLRVSFVRSHFETSLLILILIFVVSSFASAQSKCRFSISNLQVEYLALPKKNRSNEKTNDFQSRRDVDRVITAWALESTFNKSDLSPQEKYLHFLTEIRSQLKGVDLLPSTLPADRTLRFVLEVQKIVQSLSEKNKIFAIGLFGSIVNGRSHIKSDLDYTVFELPSSGSQQWNPSIRNPADLLKSAAQSELGFDPRVHAPSDDPPSLKELHDFVVNNGSTMIIVYPDKIIWRSPLGELQLN